MTVLVRLVVLGEPASKANGRRFVRIKGISRSIKSDKALDYAKAFAKQIRPLPSLLQGDLSLTIRIYYASRRPDLDESLILDLLQGRVYLNDRQVRERHAYWGLDPSNPRAEIEISQMLALPEGPNTGPKGRSRKKSYPAAGSRGLGGVSTLR